MYLEIIYDRNANKHLIKPAEETCIRDESDSEQEKCKFLLTKFGSVIKSVMSHKSNRSGIIKTNDLV